MSRRVVVKVQAVVAASSILSTREIGACIAEALADWRWTRDGSPIDSVAVVSAREERRKDGWIPISDLMGSNVIPQSAADVFLRAVEKLRKEEHRKDRPPWQLIEILAADYLAGR